MMTDLRPRVGRLAAVCGAVALMVLGTVTAARAQGAPPITGDPIAGRRLFVERECVNCHSIWGNGGTLGPDFALVGAGRSLQQLAGLFWNHTPRMIETVRRRGVPWPTFTADELADFISYVYYVKLFDEPGNPELGERWFREMRCRECHSLGGGGGAVGPALDSYARYPAPIRLAQGMWNSGPSMRARLAHAACPCRCSSGGRWPTCRPTSARPPPWATVNSSTSSRQTPTPVEDCS